MKISPTNSTTPFISRLSSSRTLEESSSREQRSLQASQTTKTNFSGRSLMLSRVFGGHENEPAVALQLTGKSYNLPQANFLTTSDRELLSSLYDTVVQEGISLNYIDDLAFDLGRYRMVGAITGNVNDGGMFDADGRLQRFGFSQKDTVIANRILTGGGIQRSPLDAGFVKFLLDPGYSFNHRTHFGFLESLVGLYSAGSSSMPARFDERYKNYENQGSRNFTIELSKEVILAPATPDYINYNGRFEITDLGRINGFKLVNGQPVKAEFDLPMPDTSSIIRRAFR